MSKNGLKLGRHNYIYVVLAVIKIVCSLVHAADRLSAVRLTLIMVLLCRFTLIQSVCCQLALHLMTCRMIHRPDTNILLSSAGERK